MVCSSIPTTTGISYTTKTNGFTHNDYLQCDTSGYNSSVQVNCQNYGGQATIVGSCIPNNCTITPSQANANNINLANDLFIVSGRTSSALTCNTGYNGSPNVSCNAGVATFKFFDPGTRRICSNGLMAASSNLTNGS